MELSRLRQLAGITEADERKAPANLTVKPAGKDPMSVKHNAGADPRDAAPANLTVKPAGKDPMSVKHAAGADPRDAAPKNLTVKPGGNKSLREEELMEANNMVDKIMAKVKSIHAKGEAAKEGEPDVHKAVKAALKDIHDTCSKHM